MVDASATAWAFLVGYCTSIYFTVQYGGGVHQWDVPLGHVIEFAKVQFLRSLWYTLHVTGLSLTRHSF